ncbi:TPA: hypothetical protein DCX16_04900 [bacterium]|nr:hypothetical protein [bacterium]
MKILRFLYIFIFFSSFLYAKTIAFLDFVDKTLDKKGEEELRLVISTLFPSERFTMVDREKVKKRLPLSIQRELGTITPEIAWTIGEVLECDIIAIGSIEGSLEQKFINFHFIETSIKKDPDLPLFILDLFLSHFGVSTRVEKIITSSDFTIPLSRKDGIKLGDRFDVIRNQKKIGEGQIVSVEPNRSYISLSYGKVSLFDIIRKSCFEARKTKEFLLIDTKPKGNVFWKKKEIGISPILINDRIEGELTIKKEGFYDRRCDVYLPYHPYSSIDLCLFLSTLKVSEKRPSSLLVSSQPENAEVFINEKLFGVTPVFITNIDDGVYELVVKKDGFESHSQKVLVEGDVEIKVDLYSVTIPKPPVIKKEEKRLSELIFLETAYCLKQGELEIGLVYPKLFILRMGLPSKLKTEIRFYGIGFGMKYNIFDYLGIDVYYQTYNMKKNKKEDKKGFWLIGNLPSRLFNLHLGGGYSGAESSKLRYFLGIDVPIKEKLNILVELEKEEGFGFGFYRSSFLFDAKLGMGVKDKKINFSGGIYIKKL